MKKLALVATIAAFAGCGNAWAAGTPCDGLKNINLPHTEITIATLVEKGAFTQPPNPQQMQMANLRAVRVADRVGQAVKLAPVAPVAVAADADKGTRTRMSQHFAA